MSLAELMPADPDPRPAFAEVETWVFDLDNTLYPPHERLFDQIERLIADYVQRGLGVEEAEAVRETVAVLKQADLSPLEVTPRSPLLNPKIPDTSLTCEP